MKKVVIELSIWEQETGKEGSEEKIAGKKTE